MVIVFEVYGEGSERPAEASPLRVELRDTSLADAPSVTVGAATGRVREMASATLDTVELTVARVPRGCTAWAHVDVDGDGRVSKGDFVTTVAYPVPETPRGPVQVRVRKV